MTLTQWKARLDKRSVALRLQLAALDKLRIVVARRLRDGR